MAQAQLPRKSNIKEIPVATQSLEQPRKALVLLYLVAGAWYLTWRAGTLNSQALFFSLVLYAGELYGFVTSLLHIFMCWKLTIRQAPPPAPGLRVAVFVPTYNEDAQLVRKTLIAALRMDYPHTTWLLDDGNRAEMKALARELGCRYLTRGSNEHAKAGNLNNALRHSDADFVAVFDADHAPRRDFLVCLLGYFNDPRVAFVQAPQDFFNLDSYQHRRIGGVVWTEQSLFFRVIQRGKDYWNAAFFCGSCAIVRRRALDDIGGFATGTTTEDLHTSIRLHAKGWRSVYHAESLAFGLAPENIEPFLSQRIRWGQGAMHVWRKEGVLTNKGLTPAQRLNYFASMATYFDGWQKGIFYAAPVIVLTTASMPIVTDMRDFLWHFLPFYLLNFWMFEEIGRGFGRTLFIEQYNMARFAAFAWSTLALFMRPLRFRVTPKGQAAERWSAFTIPQLAVLFLNVGAIPVGLLVYAYFRRLPVDGLVANMVWASINALLALAVVRFNKTTATFRRSAYRFPVPLPVNMEFQTGPSVAGTIIDISSDGFRYHGRFPENVASGDAVRGTLRLPDGPLAFSAVVRSRIGRRQADGTSDVTAIGCQFNLDKTSWDRIAAFLYGSDLQWQINEFREEIRTPLVRLLPRFFGSQSRPLSLPGRWAACRIEDGKSDLCLFTHTAESGSRWGTALLFSYIGDVRRVALRIHAPEGERLEPVELTLSTTLGTGEDALYVYQAAHVAPENEETCGPPTKLRAIA